MSCDCEGCFQLLGWCEFDPGEERGFDDAQDEVERAPGFGCACENPLTVDTVCEHCIEWMKEQEATPDADQPSV